MLNSKAIDGVSMAIPAIVRKQARLRIDGRGGCMFIHRHVSSERTHLPLGAHVSRGRLLGACDNG